MLATVYRLLQDVESCLTQSSPICPADSIRVIYRYVIGILNKVFMFSATPILIQPSRWLSQLPDNGDKSYY